ncbi:hypothetical protein MPTK1_1g08710 [Marchantia polymorpha subsp. ruderalis]|uniref:Uncharacterized protein n=2 Tax=Marchantia polymorpha TaxID=3197 RepID=A0AAF6AN13_MARPO|nr:hypothetical protein MARPO_0036s0114 [Marchantia polymorpha]BBM97833.1 hypothetical protein Mp_1g08710 [Marchantia polymorpha subsp. ruderalis]|eukprot:PTQ41136.1 hypothetical protein MARPO_0036s0114 [Marchantia polymorpha]
MADPKRRRTGDLSCAWAVNTHHLRYSPSLCFRLWPGAPIDTRSQVPREKESRREAQKEARKYFSRKKKKKSRSQVKKSGPEIVDGG